MRHLVLFTPRLLVSLVVLVAGCATTENYEKMLNTWVGASEVDLVKKWGPPDSVYEGAGSRFLTWNRTGQVYVPGMPTYQTYRIGNTIYTQPALGPQGYIVNEQCKTTFELKAERVASWRWEGNVCKLTAREVPREVSATDKAP